MSLDLLLPALKVKILCGQGMVLNRYTTMNADPENHLPTWYRMNTRVPRFVQSLDALGLPAEKALDVLPEQFHMVPLKSYGNRKVLSDGQKQQLAVDSLCQILGYSCPKSKRGNTIAGVGTVIASGVNGTTVRLPRHGSPRKVFSILSHGANQVKGKIRDYASERYLVKVQVCRDANGESDTIREDLIHCSVAESSVTVRGESIEGDTIVPEFIIGATLASKSGTVCRVTLMGMVDAIPADSRQLKLPVESVVGIEKALLFLWCFGVSHSDLHFGNILIDKFGSPTIIDLGYSVKLPEELRARMRAAVERLPPEADTWPLYNKYYLPFASIVLLRRGFDQGNPDTQALRRALDKFPRAEVLAARRALYGVQPVHFMQQPIAWLQQLIFGSNTYNYNRDEL